MYVSCSVLFCAINLLVATCVYICTRWLYNYCLNWLDTVQDPRDLISSSPFATARDAIQPS